MSSSVSKQACAIRPGDAVILVNSNGKRREMPVREVTPCRTEYANVHLTFADKSIWCCLAGTEYNVE